jgi:hypothetical protein
VKNLAAAALTAVGLLTAAPAWADTLDVFGPTGIPTPNAAELASEELLAEDVGFTPTGSDPVIAEYTPEQNSEASYLTGETDAYDEIEAQFHAGDISPTDELYVAGYSQSSTFLSVIMPDLASGTAPGTDTPIAGDAIPLDDLHFVLVGNLASDPDNVGGVAGVDGYDNVYPNFADLLGFSALAGAKTPNDLYAVDSFAVPEDNWAIATDPHDLSPIEHYEYYALPYLLGQNLLADTTETQADNGNADYFTFINADINQFTALWEAFEVSLNITP